MTREAFEEWVGKGLHLERIPTGAPFAGDYRNIVMQTRWDAWQAATNAALDRAAVVRMKLPPAKYGENASTIQGVYQDAFDRGWKAGIAEMRKAIRALKESKE
jgi:hypothetical protein